MPLEEHINGDSLEKLKKKSVEKMWDHWRSGVFTDPELLNDENKLLKCILKKQRREMVVLAKQIAALHKIKSKNAEKNDNCSNNAQNPPVPKPDIIPVFSQSGPTIPAVVQILPEPVFTPPEANPSTTMATKKSTSATQPIETSKNDSNPSLRKSASDSLAPKTVQHQIVQIVPTVQPEFRIEALRKQPRKIAPKRSRSPNATENLKDHQRFRKSRRSKRKKSAKQK